MEQVIVADPEIVLTWDRNFFDRVKRDPLWAGIRAVREDRVYLAPTAPFGWIDRPPSLNRVIGLRWLAGLFYPDQLGHDLRETTRAFYRLFYHVDPGDADLDTLIAWSKGQAILAQALRPDRDLDRQPAPGDNGDRSGERPFALANPINEGRLLWWLCAFVEGLRMLLKSPEARTASVGLEASLPSR